MINMDKCSVLVSSCDKYEDAWIPFFHFFKKFWNECPYKIYLNTESKKYIDKDLDICVLNCKENVSWSIRLKKALKQISTEYVIFLLEDFFFLDKVNQDEIDRCIGYMENDKKISVIDFEYVPRIPTLKSEYPGYVERQRSGMYFLNCQAAIWRRKDLMRFLNPYENPWQFELYGTERAKLYDRKFLLQEAETKPVFTYYFCLEKGYGLHGGKWLRSNVDLFAKEGINVDFARMGFYENGNVDTTCLAPRKCTADRWMYFWYGGGSKPRTEIHEWLSLIFESPRTFLSLTKAKLKFAFTKNYR